MLGRPARGSCRRFGSSHQGGRDHAQPGGEGRPVLGGLKDKLIADEKEDERLYNKFACWCKKLSKKIFNGFNNLTEAQRLVLGDRLLSAGKVFKFLTVRSLTRITDQTRTPVMKEAPLSFLIKTVINDAKKMHAAAEEKRIAKENRIEDGKIHIRGGLRTFAEYREFVLKEFKEDHETGALGEGAEAPTLNECHDEWDGEKEKQGVQEPQSGKRRKIDKKVPEKKQSWSEALSGRVAHLSSVPSTGTGGGSGEDGTPERPPAICSHRKPSVRARCDMRGQLLVPRRPRRRRRPRTR